MNVLLLIPQQYYGFHDTMQETFASLGATVHSLEGRHQVSRRERQINDQMFRFPASVRNRWESYYLGKINAYYIQEYDRLKPDVVFVYNHEFLLPETVRHFRKKSKVAFFLGDCPYYTPFHQYFLSLLFHADAVYTTDTFWIGALHKLGIRNLNHMYPSIPSRFHYKKGLPEALRGELASDVLYIGMNYKTSWGYKKAKFLSAFTRFDLQIHGDDDWARWFGDFPELKPRFRPRTGYVSVERMNEMYNATKIGPVDANPGLLHAVHWRMLEVLGSGALPVMEWQNGVVELFGEGSDVPAVRNFEEATELTAYYLDHDDKRLEMVEWMRGVIEENHSVAVNAKLISETLGLGVKTAVL